MAKKSKKSPAKKSATTAKSKAKKTISKTKTKASPARAAKTLPKAKATVAPTTRKTTSEVVEYKLFTEDSVRNLEDQVNYHIKKGWSPVGGVVLQGQNTFMQTMVRHDS